MAYQANKTYYLIPLGAVGTNDTARNEVLYKIRKPVALNIRGITRQAGFFNGRNVNVWQIDYSSDMRWKLSLNPGDGFARFLCAGNTVYGLDYYYGSDNPGKCGIYKVADNVEDSKINLITINANKDLYKLQCYRNDTGNDLYLTAGGVYEGADVFWTGYDEARSDMQTWWLVPEDAFIDTAPQPDYTYPTREPVRWLSRGYSAYHNGIDILDTPYDDYTDVPVYAFADGIVTYSAATGGDDGNTVRIKHGQLFGNGRYIETRYLHLRYRPVVNTGDYVSKGQFIGYMGNTGNSTGTHLHFEIAYKSIDFAVPSGYYEAEGYYDPLIYLPEYRVL